VNDAVTGRDHAHRLERALRPLHEKVPLGVSLEFDFLIALHGVRPVVDVDFHRVVHHDIDGHQRLDVAGRYAQPLGGCAHRGEIVERAEADQVLEHDTHHDERNFSGARAFGFPRGKGFHVLFGDALAVAVAHQCFEHDAQATREARNLSQARGLERGE
jgi:hypothetical protein